jgi:hypothetical protein
MPRHAQPREVAEAKGLVKHNPQRYRNTPPKAAFALGNPPEHMLSEARAVWFELDTYAAAGVLTCADRLVLELASNMIAEYREHPAAYPATKIGQLVGLLGRLGMSPADRQRLSVPKAETTNPFEAF